MSVHAEIIKEFKILYSIYRIGDRYMMQTNVFYVDKTGFLKPSHIFSNNCDCLSENSPSLHLTVFWEIPFWKFN